MPLPPSIASAPATLAPATTTTTTATATATASSETAPHPSLFHRLIDSVPEHAAHLFDRLFAPNTTLYSPPKNDPHDSTSEPSSPVEERAPQPKMRRHSHAVHDTKRKSAAMGNVIEVNGCQLVGEETERPSEEYGFPLCRESEIEKWKVGKGKANVEEEEKPGKMRRRKTIH